MIYNASLYVLATMCIFMCKMISNELSKNWFDLHLSESQRVTVAFPVKPFHAVSVRRVGASQIATVQVGGMTFAVPPGTFERHCT